MVTGQPLGAHPAPCDHDVTEPLRGRGDHRVFIKKAIKLGDTQTSHGPDPDTDTTHPSPEIFIMVITSNGPQLRFYLSIVIQIGEKIPTYKANQKTFIQL